MRKSILLIALMCALSAGAQVSAILGDWMTVDDKTGEERSVVSIYKGQDGLYYGKIKKMLVGEPELRCTKCVDADYNVPIEGLVIIRGMRAQDGQLILRGSLDKRGFIGRSQTWRRSSFVQ